MILFRGQKIQTSVERMFRIWKERRVYDNSFLKELEQLIEPARQAQTPSQLTGPSFKVGRNIDYFFNISRSSFSDFFFNFVSL
jgi:hypothetical protein